jgi:hypothetical protein
MTPYIGIFDGIKIHQIAHITDNLTDVKSEITILNAMGEEFDEQNINYIYKRLSLVSHHILQLRDKYAQTNVGLETLCTISLAAGAYYIMHKGYVSSKIFDCIPYICA